MRRFADDLAAKGLLASAESQLTIGAGSAAACALPAAAQEVIAERGYTINDGFLHGFGIGLLPPSIGTRQAKRGIPKPPFRQKQGFGRDDDRVGMVTIPDIRRALVMHRPLLPSQVR